MCDLSGLASTKGLLEHASPILTANLFGENGLCSSEKHMKSSSWNMKFLVKSDLETFGSVFKLRESLRNVLKCKAVQVSSIIGFGPENHVWHFFVIAVGVRRQNDGLVLQKAARHLLNRSLCDEKIVSLVSY